MSNGRYNVEKHHQESLDNYLEVCRNDESILAVLLVGSIAHGFDRPDSDVDLCLVVDPDEFSRRKAAHKLAFSVREYCTWEGGYLDCKVVDVDFLKQVAESGSDPARYAFKDSRIVYTKLPDLEQLLADIVTYPAADIETRRDRFASQILAWKWYYSEGVKKENLYLRNLAVHKLVLFGTRIVLNENRMLYPFHKWMLRVLASCDRTPEGFIGAINDLLANHTLEKVNSYCDMVFAFIGYTDQSVDWPNWFMSDSEQNWIEHEAPIDDL